MTASVVDTTSSSAEVLSTVFGAEALVADSGAAATDTDAATSVSAEYEFDLESFQGDKYNVAVRSLAMPSQPLTKATGEPIQVSLSFDGDSTIISSADSADDVRRKVEAGLPSVGRVLVSLPAPASMPSSRAFSEGICSESNRNSCVAWSIRVLSRFGAASDAGLNLQATLVGTNSMISVTTVRSERATEVQYLRSEAAQLPSGYVYATAYTNSSVDAGQFVPGDKISPSEFGKSVGSHMTTLTSTKSMSATALLMSTAKLPSPFSAESVNIEPLSASSVAVSLSALPYSGGSDITDIVIDLIDVDYAGEAATFTVELAFESTEDAPEGWFEIIAGEQNRPDALADLHAQSDVVGPSAQIAWDSSADSVQIALKSMAGLGSTIVSRSEIEANGNSTAGGVLPAGGIFWSIELLSNGTLPALSVA